MREITQSVLDFWFGPQDSTGQIVPQTHWFKSTPALDSEIADRFGALHTKAINGGFDNTAETADDYLAIVIMLDQFPRNMFRNTPAAFASDPLALSWAKRAVDLGHDLAQPAPHRRMFFYLPFEHSENLDDQDTCVRLMAKLDHEDYLKYAHLHRDVIVAYGRFPHRNAILGRQSTPEEQTYLDQPGAGF